jgi:hypothetical protein
MSARTHAFIVCSPHARTGVTTFARLFADFFTYTRQPFVGFDTDPHESTFAQCFLRDVAVADLATIQGQVALFDNLLLTDGIPKVVDVWTRAWRSFFDIATSTEFFAEAARRGVRPYLLYIPDGSEQALQTVEDMLTKWPELGLAVIGNEGTVPLGAGGLDYLARFPAVHTFELKALDPVVRRAIEDPGFSFSKFLLDQNDAMSIVVRASLRSWLLPIFQQFQSFQLKLAMEDSRYF